MDYRNAVQYGQEKEKGKKEFVFYCVISRFIIFLGSLIFPFFFLTTKKKAKNWHQHLGLCGKGEFTYLCKLVYVTHLDKTRNKGHL